MRGNTGIDEQITPFKGRSHMKPYLESKPHKWGYEVVTRVSSSGITHVFVIYERKGTAEEHRFGIFIVCDLVKDLSLHMNDKVFFDN